MEKLCSSCFKTKTLKFRHVKNCRQIYYPEISWNFQFHADIAVYCGIGDRCTAENS